MCIRDRYQGFVEKRGTKMTFGYDDLREKDGWSDSQKAGDRLVENGSFDLAKLDYIVEDYTEREGVKLERNYYEFKKLSDGSIICLSLSGQSMNSSGNGVLTNDAIYLHNGVGQYDFVVANAFVGPEFTSVNFATSDMTKAQAIAAFKAAGYTITTSGGIKNGKLVLDPS